MKFLFSGLALAVACSVALGDTPPPRPTYHRHITPILQKHCQQCHRPGEAAPMSLLTYKEVRPWAKAVRDAVLSRRMPPWKADPGYGEFAHDRRLSQAEVETIRNWVDAGSPEGDSKDAPPPLRFVEGWNIQQPDLVFQMPVEFEVPATGPIEYVHFVVPTEFTEDRWVQQMEVRPGNRAVVHHIGVFLRLKGSKWLSEGRPGEAFTRKDRRIGRLQRDELLAQFIPGIGPQLFPDTMGRLIPAGSDLIFQIHYQANGKPGKDRSRVGLVFSKKPPIERVHTLGIADTTFAIPPQAPAHLVKAKWPILTAARMLNISPHMHLRGKSFECRLELKDKTVKPLVRISSWDRNWQLVYDLAEPLAIEPVSWIYCDAVFDNSPNNPANPDPTAEVRWGDQTTDEMMVAYADVVIPADLDIIHLYRRKP